MAITLGNYAATLSPDLIQLAKKNKVRECDETEKGHFVAYVDDGNESFDVSLTIKAGNEITAHTCECNNNGGLCRHKAALIIHIAAGKKTKEVVKVKKKQSKTEALLDDIDPNALKEWVKSLISKNKDIELLFVNRFSVKEQLAPADVAKLVNDTVKSVAGNKKAIDLTQLKKIVEIWSDVLAPITEHYQGNVTDEKSFLNFHEMLETCIAFQFKADSGSNKILKFIEGTLLKSVGPIGNLEVEESWDKAVGYFINHVPEGVNRVREHYLYHLKNIIDVSEAERKIKIVDRLAKQYEKSKPDTLFNGTLYTKFIFEISEAHNLLPKYSRFFKPIIFDNDYNQKLIRLLIDNNELGLAKKYCEDQIRQNYREEYNLLYLNFLREIALLQNDEPGLEKVITILFPYSFNFDDYLFISKKLPEDERKKWRTKILARARSVSHPYKKDAVEFCFKLAGAEKNYRKMIDYIDQYTPYRIIFQYCESMLMADKSKFLEALFRKSDDYSWHLRNEDEEKDTAYFPELFKLMEKHYTGNYLKAIISSKERDRWYFSPNKFVSYIKRQLSAKKT